jgi:hypothetical protein
VSVDLREEFAREIADSKIHRGETAFTKDSGSSTFGCVAFAIDGHRPRTLRRQLQLPGVRFAAETDFDNERFASDGRAAYGRETASAIRRHSGRRMRCISASSPCFKSKAGTSSRPNSGGMTAIALELYLKACSRNAKRWIGRNRRKE